MNNLLFFSFLVVASFLLTELIRRYTLKKNLIDTPNERSSHTVPTPRGGGLSIVVIFLIAISYVDSLPTDIFIALIGSGGESHLLDFWMTMIMFRLSGDYWHTLRLHFGCCIA
jgi:Fuc2NAc and GlcNAc transferase